MFAHEFVRNAYLGGTPIALACGIVGWFVVLRGQVFAGDALSHVAFVGAIAAAVLGLDARIGLFALTLLVAAGMSSLGRAGSADDVAIGIVFAWILGIGVLLLVVLATSTGGATTASTPASTLFGSIYSLTAGAAGLAAVIAIAVVAGALALTRPLLFASLDAELARVRGIPVRALGVALLTLLALVTAESTQAVGALLLLGLIAAPAGGAHQLALSPTAGIALSGAIAVGAMWAGLALAYAIPSLPPSTAIIGLAAAAYGVCSLIRRSTATA
jgi:zinc/manganese transport system permease protein